MVAPSGFANIHYWLYMVFAMFNLAFVPIVYFFMPETANRSLEEIDLIFAKAFHENRDPVKVAMQMERNVDVHQSRMVLGLDDVLSSPPSLDEKPTTGHIQDRSVKLV